MAIYHQFDRKGYHSYMEYKGIWIVFLTVWVLLRASVAVFPVAVARLLRGARPAAAPIGYGMASARRNRSDRQRGKANFSRGGSMSVMAILRP
jgi:hypothetical protein